MQTTSSLFLTGFMGAGKSTIGKRWATYLKVPFFDLDTEIEAYLGCSIRDYFFTYGEGAFRKVETLLLQEIIGREQAVVATGGGIVVSEENRHFLKQQPSVVYLATPFSVCYERILHDKNRPVAKEKTKEQLVALYEQRLPLYKETAQYEINPTLYLQEELVKYVETFKPFSHG
ncbi:shikimate kinase [Bacillus fonticola]|uniref:shikimate kinase n=1 Tax=Bacillus fonticola TaxID=2728853 RepID=UPI001475F450|nr:shikimate kinase [Bacillus fonticola]